MYSITRFMLTMVSLALVSLVSQPVSAQGIQAKQIRAAMDREINKIKSAQEQRMATSIDDLHRACELSDEQKTKLQVASKGAVEKSMVATRKQFIDTMKSMGVWAQGLDQNLGEVEGDEADAEESDADEANDEDVMTDFFGDDELGYVVEVMQSQGFGDKLLPEKQKLWTSTIEKTLTEEQAQKYAAFVGERNARCRKSAVDSFVSSVDLELLLTAEQRGSLVKLVDEKYGDVLLKNLTRPGDYETGFTIGGETGNSLINKDVCKVLSDSQYLTWKSRFAGQLESIAELNGQNAVRGGGFWGGLFGN